MTGLYRESIKARLTKARADVEKCRKSLAGLTNTNSEYAQEHRALLTILERVRGIYEESVRELAAGKR